MDGAHRKMKRLIFVWFDLAIVALNGVRGDICDDTNVDSRYDACLTDVFNFRKTHDTSVSRCKSLYKDAADCYDKLRGHCGNGPIAKALEDIEKASLLRRTGNYTCSHLRIIQSLQHCAGDATQFSKCMVRAVQASQSKKDTCAWWNTIHPCYAKLYEKCPAELRKDANTGLGDQRPVGCKSHGTKTSVGLASVVLSSTLIVLLARMA